MQPAPFAPGDWVRFYQHGELVIAEVAYVRNVWGSWFAQTAKGEVREDGVLEIRPKMTVEVGAIPAVAANRDEF